MSTDVQPLPQRARWSHRRAVWLVALVACAGAAVAVTVAAEHVFGGDGTRSSRPELQQILDRVVRSGDAPGVTAYVVGPHGLWQGSAGVADVKTGAAMRSDARMRIESLSKTWLTAVILQLAQEGKLSVDDTVARWLPGLLRAHGSQITIRELMNDASGLIDDNDVSGATPGELRAYFARVGDPGLLAQLSTTVARVKANPFTPIPALLLIRLAAWQPLVAPPGTTYHHSNIGWNVVGLIAEKVSGKPLRVLYRERLFRPLKLRNTAFSPQGPIEGQHANGYARDARGRLIDTTAMHPAKFADGAIVTNARDEAAFLRAAMNGTLFAKASWLDLYGAPLGTNRCGAPAYAGEGGGDGYRSYVWYDTTGSRISVLLVNKNRGRTAADAALSLYCNA